MNKTQTIFWISQQPVDYGKDDSGYYQDHPTPIFTNTFQLDQAKNCTLHIAACGFWTCQINGKPVTDAVLNGPWTNYQKVVYYQTFDISSLVHEGENTVRIELGNGYYNPSPLRFFGKYNLRKNLSEVGMPEIAMVIQSGEQTILQTDERWTYTEGNTLFNNLYLGERVDLRPKPSKRYPVVVKTRNTPLKAQTMPPIKKGKEVKPVQIETRNEELLVDFGEMISGMIDINFEAKEGQIVKLRFAEGLNPDGTPNYFSNANGSVGEVMPDGHKIDGGSGAPDVAVEMDEIICKDGNNHFTNQFTYHSFRYCIIEGLKKEHLQQIKAIYVHTDVEAGGSVATNDPKLNHLYDAAVRTKRNNFHSTFEDCARERLGYGGDMVSLADSNLYLFQLKETYEKIVLDFVNDQTEAGGYPETAPYIGIQSHGTAPKEGPLLWQMAVPYLSYKLIQYYDDKEFVRKIYPSIQKFVDYILSRPIEEVSRCCLGDHGSVLIMGQFYKPTPDKPLVGYCTILWLVQIWIKLGCLLDKDMAHYEVVEKKLKEQTLRQFKQNETFGDGTQTGLAFAAMVELDDQQALVEQLVKQIEADNGVFTAGIFGMKFTYELLHKYGYDELVEHWLRQEGSVSYLSMLKSGNRAMAELFAGTNYSYNHAMFTSFIQWYFEGLGGVKIGPDAIGFNQVVLHPYFSDSLSHCGMKLETMHGPIESVWDRKDGKIVWHVTMPKAIQYTIQDSNASYQLILDLYD